MIAAGGSMTKIYYYLTGTYDLDSITYSAKRIGVDVTIKRLPEDLPKEELQEQIRQWEQEGAEIILCRGAAETRIMNMVSKAYVMGVNFSADSTIEILSGYQRLHPHFFEQKRRVLLISTKLLSVNVAVLKELFQVEVENLPTKTWFAEHHANEEDLDAYAATFDLVITGTHRVERMTKKGINAFYFPNSERDTFYNNFMIADIIAKSRRELKEKNAVIQSILDNSFNAILTLNQDGIILRGNGQLKRYFKENGEKLVGKNISDLMPDFNRELLKRLFVEQEEFYGEVAQFQDSMLIINGFPIYENGQIISGALNFEELRQIEKIEQRVKSELYNKGRIAKYTFQDIIGESESMKQTKHYAKEFARHSSNILLYGESGTGKELFAQSIHNESACKNGPFVAVNCGALPANLLESELFGYAAGSFTGASKNGKKGLIEQANQGTLFLDEISEMDPLGQVRLLRVLAEHTIVRVGDDKVIPVDVRIIAASNKNLKKLVEEGKFREDLYYRLNVLMLKIPALRERKGDVVRLTEYYLHHFGDLNKKHIELTEDAMQAMAEYPWTGNVRQLRNFCERLVIISMTRIVDREFVVRQLNDSFFDSVKDSSAGMVQKNPKQAEQMEAELPETKVVERKWSETKQSETKQLETEEHVVPQPPYHSVFSKADSEYDRILDALNRAHGNRGTAAEILGISKTSLWRRMKKFNISEKY